VCECPFDPYDVATIFYGHRKRRQNRFLPQLCRAACSLPCPHGGTFSKGRSIVIRHPAHHPAAADSVVACLSWSLCLCLLLVAYSPYACCPRHAFSHELAEQNYSLFNSISSDRLPLLAAVRRERRTNRRRCAKRGRLEPGVLCRRMSVVETVSSLLPDVQELRQNEAERLVGGGFHPHDRGAEQTIMAAGDA